MKTQSLCVALFVPALSLSTLNAFARSLPTSPDLESITSATFDHVQNSQAIAQLGQQSATGSTTAQTIAQPLTQSQRWALACPALLFTRNHERFDSLDSWESKPENIEVQKRTLSQSWGVDNRDQLLGMLTWVDEGGGHRKSWKEMSELNNENDSRAYIAKHPKLTSEALERKLVIVRQYDKVFGDKGILAWDYCRYIALCRWGAYVGYLSKDEAWRKIMPVARKLQIEFKSWEELGLNYLIGRKFWSKDETEKSGNEFQINFEQLLKDEKRPWKQLAWTTDLSPKVSNGY